MELKTKGELKDSIKPRLSLRATTKLAKAKMNEIAQERAPNELVQNLITDRSLTMQTSINWRSTPITPAQNLTN